MDNVSRTYDNYGNVLSIGNDSLSYTRGNLLSSYRGGSYEYNHQGVRFRKTVGGVTTEYYLDGDKILGEDRHSGGGEITRLRFVYDASGICGIRRRVGGGRWENFLYLKDALGNVTGIMRGVDDRYRLVCRYGYTAFGETAVLNPDGSAGEFGAEHIASVNPFIYKLRTYKNGLKVC